MKITDSLALSLSAVAGTRKFGAGLDLGYNAKDSKLTTYNATAYWHEDNHQLALKHESKNSDEVALGNLVFSAYKKVSDDLQVGGNFAYKSDG